MSNIVNFSLSSDMALLWWSFTWRLRRECELSYFQKKFPDVFKVAFSVFMKIFKLVMNLTVDYDYFSEIVN